jgi:adenine-specific DNA-methyltransferase
MGKTKETIQESSDRHAAEMELKIAKLADLFPECFTSSRDELNQPKQTVDINLLRQKLSGHVDVSVPERYQLEWPGKQASLDEANTQSNKEFIECRNDSVDFDSTKNLFIEGDNLDAIKLLNQTHQQSLKLIYIDPPYNTGRDFTYCDDRVESEAGYLIRTKQVSKSGERLVDNPEASGRFHSHWLSMLLPRLVAARGLLRIDGAIAVSVDDNEVARLTCLLDEVFGRENRIVDFVWQTKAGAKGVPPRKMVTQNHEYILVYARDATQFRFKGRPRDSSAFSNPDNDPRGPWKKDNMKSTVSGTAEYCIVDPDSGREFKARWAFSKDTVQRMILEGRVLFPASQSGWPAQKSFLNEYQNQTIPVLSLLGHDYGGTATGAKDIAAVLGSRDLFSYPKPVGLLSFLISQVATQEDDCVMDFFAGSGTFGEAVFAATAQDSICRRFILVQLDDELDPSKPVQAAAVKFCDSLRKPRTIAEIAKERVRRSGQTIKQKTPNLDVGFRVLKMDTLD